MQYRNTLVICSLTFFLFGCAKVGPEKPSDKVSNEKVINLKSGGYIKSQGLEYLETDTQAPSDTVLRVITKGDTTGAAAAKAASFVITALIGGSTSQSTFSKHELRGTKIDSVVNPSISYFLPKMNQVIEESLQVNDGADYRNTPLTVTYSNFYLVYSELAGSSNYELTYAMNISTSYPGKYKFDCSFTSSSYPLEEWSANGYQKVKDISKSKLDECLLEFGKESNLKSLSSDLAGIKKK